MENCEHMHFKYESFQIASIEQNVFLYILIHQEGFKAFNLKLERTEYFVERSDFERSDHGTNDQESARKKTCCLHLLFFFRYKEGMLKARQGEDMETEQVVQSVAEGMLTITHTRGHDAVEDWEVDELLEWTNGLNFDQYVTWLFCKSFHTDARTYMYFSTNFQSKVQAQTQDGVLHDRHDPLINKNK